MTFSSARGAWMSARLAQLAVGEPAGLVPEVGGPHVHDVHHLVRSYLRAAGKHRPVLQIRAPGQAAAAFRAGVDLAPDRAVGQLSWEAHRDAAVAA